MKDFDRWYRTDDTPQWKRTGFRFLWVTSLVVVLAVVVWWVLAN